jgi:hypothetical protein
MWRKAESVALAMDMDYELARARLELARHDGGAERDSLLADAVGTFTRLGAERHLRIPSGA